tara:strand:+ start:44 stop:286 length:243 start_codon:yes stop_codon:yes gene_type:complete
LDPKSNILATRLIENIVKGTLVEVKISNWNEPPTLCMGIVLDTSPKNNDILFPSAMVYNLETKQITREFLGTLKVISKVD